MDKKDYQRIYLSGPFREKEEAKKLGAYWEPNVKKWYIPESLFET